ncbi:MAG: hypothetical protein R2851_27055 [Caldilineaceae bacterium]
MGTDLVDLRVFQLAEELAQMVWDDVAKWDRFSRVRSGEQLVRATVRLARTLRKPMVAIYEGEKLRFTYYAVAAFTDWYWLRQALKRELIRREQADTIRRN